MRSSRFRVLQWLYSAVSHSYICENRRVRFLPVKVYERYVEDRLLSVCSKERNQKLFRVLFKCCRFDFSSVHFVFFFS